MIKRAILLTLALILILVTPTLAAEAGKGTITGQLVNETKGGGSVAGQTVTLKTYLNDKEGASTNTKTDDKGNFKFDNLSTEAAYSYKVTVNYQGADYESQSIKFERGETTKSAKLTVYDATTSDAAISASTGHTIIYMEQGGLTVLEYVVLTNSADKTYVGTKDLGEGRKEILKFALPKGASNIELRAGLMDCCVVNTAEGFDDTMPFIAGTTNEVAFSYRIKPSSNFTFNKVFYNPTASYDLLVQDDTGLIQVSAQGLNEDQPVDFQGKHFKRLTGRDITAGSRFAVQISGLPATSGNTQKIAVIVVLIIVIPVLAYLLIRRKKLQLATAEATASGGTNKLEREKQNLLLELARLDERRQAGKIPEADYQQLRATKKARLVKLLKRSRGRGDGD